MPLLKALIALFCLLPGLSLAAGMPMTKDLQAAYNKNGLNNQGQGKVVLLLVSQPNCSYCVQITEEILKPMLISGNYKQTTVFSELEINTGGQIVDFNGEKVDATQFARRYNAWATPTLLFLDGQGREVSNKMVGINTLELYGYYVDRSLEKGFIKINP
ncbi:hypothetical protein MED92_03762 [Neptuniibacter caesariensis]|uniref:Thioredoxin domain-containing protein n=2 Tax=Neptuniibacter caesariensis TaxID=207954 RepID=A0A7U8C6L7_NEPCE|nr:hypothetical protein MED92_03762 [Neptuniibacter caesariensis]